MERVIIPLKACTPLRGTATQFSSESALVGQYSLVWSSRVALKKPCDGCAKVTPLKGALSHSLVPHHRSSDVIFLCQRSHSGVKECRVHDTQSALYEYMMG